MAGARSFVSIDTIGRHRARGHTRHRQSHVIANAVSRKARAAMLVFLGCMTRAGRATGPNQPSVEVATKRLAGTLWEDEEGLDPLLAARPSVRFGLTTSGV